MKYFYLKNRNKEFLILTFIIILALNFPSSVFYDIYSFDNFPVDKNLEVSRRLNGEKENLLFEKNIYIDLNIINRNFGIIKNNIYLEYKKLNFDDFIFDKNIFVTGSINNPVYKDKFIEEIDSFFEIIKFTYPEFIINPEKVKIVEKIKKDILKEIEIYYKDQNYIYRNILIQLLKKHLNSHFNNGHFIINNDISLFKKNIFYFSYNFDLIYDQKNDIFYYYDNGIRNYLINVNDDNPKKYIYYRGDNKYFLGYFLPFDEAKENESFYIKCLFKKEIKEELGDIKIVKLKRLYFEDFSKNSVESSKNEKILNYVWKRYKNINYIKIRSFDKFFENSLIRFANDASLLKKEKFLVIDLRDNNGGYLKYIIKWLENYFGESIPSYYRSISFDNKLLYLLKMNYYKSNNNVESYNLNLKKYHSIDDYYFSFEFEENKNYLFLKKLKNYIFIIQNYNTASASEVFINILKNFDNVFLIGTNTKGVFSYGDPALIYLKNTNIFFTIPTKYVDHNLSYNTEGNGILPHLWLPYNFQIEDEKYLINLIQNLILYEKE